MSQELIPESLLPRQMSRASMEAFSARIHQSVEQGEVDPVAYYMQLDFIQKSAELAKGQIKEQALKEAAKYGRGESVLLGVGFTCKQGSRRIQYEADPEYARLKAALKAREELLKLALDMGSKEIIDPETGEVVPKVPFYYQEDTLNLSYKK